MAKRIFWFHGILTVIVTLAATAAEQELITVLTRPCKVKESASEEDFRIFTGGKIPETPEGKCLMACVAEQFAFLINNKVNRKGILNLVNIKVSNDETKRAKVAEAIDACIDITDDHHCEAAFKVAKCLEKEIESRGLPFKITM